MATTPFDDLIVAVSARQHDAPARAAAFVKGIAQQIRDAGVDPSLLQQLWQGLFEQADRLSDAVAGNSPLSAEEEAKRRHAGREDTGASATVRGDRPFSEADNLAKTGEATGGPRAKPDKQADPLGGKTAKPLGLGDTTGKAPVSTARHTKPADTASGGEDTAG